MAAGYHAFLSYSQAADREFAPYLQRALHGFAKPWYRLRALHVFRDTTNLGANPDLWPRIEKALADSEYFLLLASPQASKSKWVARELAFWCSKKDPGKIIVVLTAGRIFWDDATRGFDWERTDALPRLDLSPFATEPLYIDFTAFHGVRLSMRNPDFLDRVASIAATLHGRPKDEISGEDVRQHRRAVRLAWSASTVLFALLVASIFLGFLWRGQRDYATRQFVLATIERLATQSLSGDNSPDRKLLLATEAVRRGEGEILPAAEQAFRQAIALHGPIPLLSRFDQAGADQGILSDQKYWHGLGASPIAHLSPGGRWLLFSMSSPRGISEIWRFDLTARLPASTLRIFDAGLVYGGVGFSTGYRSGRVISDDGRTLVAFTGFGVGRAVLVWREEAGGGVRLIRLPRDGESSEQGGFELSGDGRWLVFGRSVWDLGQPDPARSRRTLSEAPEGFARDGRLIAVRPGKDGTRVRLWRLGEAIEEEDIGPLDEAATTALLYTDLRRPAPDRMSPDARWELEWTQGSFAASSQPIRAWRLERGRRVGPPADLVADLPADRTKRSWNAAFSPDGRWLAILGSNLRLWDLRRPDPMARPAFTISTRGDKLAFGGDGRWLATAARSKEDGNQAHLWDLASEEPGVSSVPLDALEATDLEFGGGGRCLVVREDRGFTLTSVWNLDLSTMLDSAGALAGRNFSGGEWRYFFPGEAYRPTFPGRPIDPAPLDRARNLARSGKFDEAVKAFRAAKGSDPGLAIDPDRAALIPSAAYHLARGEEILESAERLESELIPLRPGEGYPIQKEYEAALAEFRLAKRANPDLPLDPGRRAGQLATRVWLSEALKRAGRGDLDGGLSLHRLIREKYPLAYLDEQGLEAAALSGWDRLVKKEAAEGRMEAARDWIGKIRGKAPDRANLVERVAYALAGRHAIEGAIAADASGDRPAAEVNCNAALEMIRKVGPIAAYESGKLVDEAGTSTAGTLLRAGRLAVRWERFEEAIARYRQTDELRSRLYGQSEGVSVYDWNALCWHGCLCGKASLVEFAGEKAVADPSDGADPDIHDTLALARGILDKFDDSIREFRYYLDRSKTATEESKARRRGWIEAMTRKEMPFTPEVLESLRKPSKPATSR